MSHDDGWRRRMAQERYGDSLTPGFARDTVAGTRSTDDTTTMFFRGQASADNAGSIAPAPYRQRPSGPGGTLGWAVAAFLAIIIAAIGGWLAHGSRDPRFVYLPTATQSSPPTASVGGSFPAFDDAEQTAAAAPPPPVVVSPSPIDRTLPSPSTDTDRPAQTARTSTPAKRPQAAPVTKRRPATGIAVVPPSIPPALQFACVNGNGPASRTMCDSPRVRRFDEQMQVAQAEVVAHGDRQLIALADRDRVVFLRHREKCDDEACLIRVYTSRIVALVKLLPAGAATPPICQPEQYTRTPLMNCWPWRLRETRKPFYSK